MGQLHNKPNRNFPQPFERMAGEDQNNMKIAVLLANMGGPDSLQSVEEYLFNIFRDPDIIDIPLRGKLRDWFARWLARKRAPESRKIYNQIGGKSPLVQISRHQAEILEKNLNAEQKANFKVFPAMRYWHPFLHEVWQTVTQNDFRQVIILSMYPFYSSTTSGSIIQMVERLKQRMDFDEREIIVIDRFGNHPAFIDVMVGQIKRALSEHPKTHFEDLLLSAHSIPMRRIKNGDPYQKEIEQAVSAIRRALPDHIRVHHSYQSKIGPVKWLEPATSDKIDELAHAGVKNLLLYPLGFVADNSETVYEMDILYKTVALEKGIEQFHRIESPNINGAFINVLKDIILEKLDGR